MIRPKTNMRVEVGLNVKDLPVDERLLEQPKGSMCDYVVHITDVREVDDQLFARVKSAFDSAG